MTWRRHHNRILWLAALVCLASADAASAWGPATHARIALDVLGQLSLLPAALAALLGRHASSFVFGNIAADVVFAKRLSRIKQFCHHWSTGFRLLNAAKQENDQAFAWGYIAHLAADTIAHGKYVPRQLSLTGTTVQFGHLYWELRADQHVDGKAWSTFERVMKDDHLHHHAELKRVMTAARLPYQVNRELFDRLNRFVLMENWTRWMRIWQHCSRWDLCPDMLTEYRAESVDRVVSVLVDAERSPVLREDPNGNAALHEAKLHRRARRQLQRRGLCTQLHVREAAASLAPGSAIPRPPSGAFPQ